MRKTLENSKIGIIGGGRVCKEILTIIYGNNFPRKNIHVLGVADIDKKAEGLRFAQEKKIFTTTDFNELLEKKGINLIIELTGDNDLLQEIKKFKPEGIRLIDHFEAMSLWDYLQIEEKVNITKKNLRKHISDPDKIEKDFDFFSQELAGIIEERTHHLQKVEKELKEKVGTLYKVLFDTDPNPIFIIDNKNFKILKVNRRAQIYYKCTENELLGKSFLDLGDGKDEELVDKLRNLAEGQCTFFSKKRHYRKDGKAFFVNINVCNSKYNEDNALIATTTDISKSVEKEMQLIQASKMTTLGTMAAGIAHELNQPLNVIQVAADFFLKKLKKSETIDTKDLHTVASEINTNVQRAAEIITQLRGFARQSDIVGTKINVNDPINDVCKILGQQLRVHQIKLKLDLEENMPMIMADHNRLIQVFINLVTNAMDALDEKGKLMGKKSWKRNLDIKTYSKSGQVIVIVSDNGIGMTEDTRQKIFEPFFTTKHVGKGTGLGTSISYSIVKEFDGSIDVISELNEGTNFILKFPSCS